MCFRTEESHRNVKPEDLIYTQSTCKVRDPLGMQSTLKSDLFLQWASLGGKCIFICKCLLIGHGFWVRDKGCVSTSFSSRPSDTDLYRPCACFNSLCEFTCTSVLLCSDGLCSLVSSIPFGSWTPSASSSIGFSEAWGEGFDGDISLVAKCFKVFYSLYFVQLWYSAFAPICCRSKILWRLLSKELCYMYSTMSFGVMLLLHSFSRRVVFGFPLGPCSL